MNASTSAGSVQFVRCVSCDNLRLDDVELCPSCWETDAKLIHFSDIGGEIISFTRIHTNPAGPYWLGYIKLDDGGTLLAPLHSSTPPHIGLRVRLTSPGHELAHVCEIAAEPDGTDEKTRS